MKNQDYVRYRREQRLAILKSRIETSKMDKSVLMNELKKLTDIPMTIKLSDTDIINLLKGTKYE